MNITEQICHKAARFDAVAFDVFDTLIKRDTATPTALFRLRGEAFYKVRVRAEQEARAAKGGEVTLAEIYARPCLAGYDPAEEVSAELAACTAYRPVLAAAQRLKQQGKRLYYISDMYLPHTQIDTMLRRCGYTFFDGGFVSCTYGVQKRSGKLFRQFLHETEQDAKQVLFIGDSWRADVIRKPPADAENGGGGTGRFRVGAVVRGVLPRAAPLPGKPPRRGGALSGAGYVPDAEGLPHPLPGGADRLSAGFPPQSGPGLSGGGGVCLRAGCPAAPASDWKAAGGFLRHGLPACCGCMAI